MAKKVILAEVPVIFRNFEGREERQDGRIVNNAGARNFSVIVPEDIVDELLEEGYHLGILKPREEGDLPRHYLKVNVSYRFKEPLILRYAGMDETPLHEDTVANLDYEDVLWADVVAGPSPRRDGDGYSAYLQELRIHIEESPFAEKYAAYGAVAQTC